jgi:hypothetical protein
MHLIETPPLSAEDGTSMVELVVGMAMGMIVLAGLSFLLIITLRGNARVDARVEASDNARVAMTRIIEELHSACVTPATAPIQFGSETNKLIFTRGTYGQAAAASQAPITTTITYVPKDGTLREVSEAGGKKEPERILLSHVSLPTNPQSNGRIFQYANNTIQAGPFTETVLTAAHAQETILVSVAFKAGPRSAPVSDTGSATEIENSATLRLTPPVFEEGKVAKPCE